MSTGSLQPEMSIGCYADEVIVVLNNIHRVSCTNVMAMLPLIHCVIKAMEMVPT